MLRGRIPQYKDQPRTFTEVEDDQFYITEAKEASSIAEILLNSTSDWKTLAAEIEAQGDDGVSSSPQVAALHSAFVAVSQWCLNLAKDEQASKFPENQGFAALILETAIRVARRTHQLSLPLPFPLYQSLAGTVADHPCFTSPLPYIIEMAKWTDTAVGPLSANFFSAPLVALARKRRIPDVIALLREMQTVYELQYLEESATQELLYTLKNEIRAMMQLTSDENEDLLLELILLLEPSIWKVFDKDPVDRTKGRLWDAVDILIDMEVNTRDVSPNQDFVQKSPIERDPMSGVASSDTYLDSMDIPKDSTSGFSSSEWQRLLEKSEGMKGVDFQISSIDGEEMTIEISRMLSPDFDDVAIDGLLYTREDVDFELPDIVSQLEKQGMTRLRYSKEFERHLLNQFEPQGIE